MTEDLIATFKRLVEADLHTPKHILVVGDGMTDVYIKGRIEACQEGCPKFMEESRVTVPGGAGNAVQTLQHWMVRRSLVFDSRFGPTKTRYSTEAGFAFRHDNVENKREFDLSLVQKLGAERFREVFVGRGQHPRPDGVLISDYDKGMLTEEFIHEIIETCRRHSIPVVADAKRDPKLYRGATIKGNETWAGRYGVSRFGESSIIVTHGKYRPTIEGIVFSSQLQDVECVNHVGAGDCFAAHLLLALTYRLSLKDAAGIAHSAARVYVQKPHNEAPWPHEILDDLMKGRLTCAR